MFHLVDAQIRGQRVSKVFVDGGAQVCVMNKKMMHKLGLELIGPSKFKATMAHNSLVKCAGVVRNV